MCVLIIIPVQCRRFESFFLVVLLVVSVSVSVSPLKRFLGQLLATENVFGYFTPSIIFSITAYYSLDRYKKEKKKSTATVSSVHLSLVEETETVWEFNFNSPLKETHSFTFCFADFLEIQLKCQEGNLTLVDMEILDNKWQSWNNWLSL